VTFSEMYTSLKRLYKNLIFPKHPNAPKWTMAELDSVDVHFFYDLFDVEEKPQEEEEIYLSDIW
jgi:hypothetical protein